MPNRDPLGRACAGMRAAQQQLRDDLVKTPAYQAWRRQAACAKVEAASSVNGWDALDCTDSYEGCIMNLSPLFVHINELGRRLHQECGAPDAASGLLPSSREQQNLSGEDDSCQLLREQLYFSDTQRAQALETLAWQAHPSCQSADAALRHLTRLQCGTAQAHDTQACRTGRESYQLHIHECQLQPEQCDVYRAPIYMRVMELRAALRQGHCRVGGP